MKIKELREMNTGQLEKLLAEKGEALRKFRFDIATKQVKNKKQSAKERKDIARILTLINEKQNNE